MDSKFGQPQEIYSSLGEEAHSLPMRVPPLVHLLAGDVLVAVLF
jgi:hypothetical protein